MRGDPGIDLGAIYTSGSTHVGDNTVKIAIGEQTQGFGAGFGGHDGVSVALQNGAHQGHHGGFVFNQKHGRTGGFGSCLGRLVMGCTPATAPKDAVSDAIGRRTVNVAPSESEVVVTHNFAAMFADNAIANAQA